MSRIVLTSDSEKRLYEERLVKSAENKSFWGAFTGNTDASVVKTKDRPEQGRGARCDYAIRPYVSPRSVTNGPLDGNERNLSFYYDNLTLDVHREAVIDDGKEQAIKAFFSIDQAMVDYIGDWTTAIYDALHFKAVLHEGGNPNYYYGGTATSTATLTASHTNTVNQLAELSVLARTGQSRAFEPMRPLMIDGREKLLYVCHPDEGEDLRRDVASYWQNAMPRSTGNPLFNFVDLEWKDVLVIEDRRMPITLGGVGGAVPISTGVLLGQQAIQQIKGSDFKIVDGAKDWGYLKGYAAEYAIGCKAPEFNSKRYGSILTKFARTNISGSNNLTEVNYTAISTANQ